MKNNDTLVAQIMRVINKFIFLEKNSILELEDLKLYPSEIHLMEVIDEDRSINATTMAERLGVTKGAVSQTISRLEKKRVLLKEKDPFNKNELTTHFTELGKEAIEKHRNLRAELHDEFMRRLDAISGDDKEVIKGFLTHLEGFVNKLN